MKLNDRTIQKSVLHYLITVFIACVIFSLCQKDTFADNPSTMRILIIASDNNPCFPDVYPRYAYVHSLQNIFKESKIPKYEINPQDVYILTYDSKDNPITVEKFENKLDSFFNSTESTSNDLNVVIYLGHGGATGIPIDDDRDLSEDTCYGYDKFAKKLSSFEGKCLYISASCLAERFRTKGIERLTGNREKFVCFFATQAGEGIDISVAKECEPYESIANHFTDSIKVGLEYKNKKLKADCIDKDGIVTLRELQTFVKIVDKIDTDCNKDNIFLSGNGSLYDEPIYQCAYLSTDNYRVKVNKGYSKGVTVQIVNPVKDVEYHVKWSVDDAGIASIPLYETLDSSEHTITINGLRTGITNLRGYIDFPGFGKCYGTDITIQIVVEDIKLDVSPKQLTLYEGENESLRATVRNTTEKPVWKSSDSSVCSVDDNGYLFGIKEGTAIITASIGDVSDSSMVTVKKPKIKIVPQQATLYLDEHLLIRATVEGRSKNVTWKSSKPSIASVPKTNGYVRALKKGTTVITATANGVSAKCKITVLGIKRYDYSKEVGGGVGSGTGKLVNTLAAKLKGVKKGKNKLYPDAYYTGKGITIGINSKASTKSPCVYLKNKGNAQLGFKGIFIGQTFEEAEKASSLRFRDSNGKKTAWIGQSGRINLKMKNNKISEFEYTLYYTS